MHGFWVMNFQINKIYSIDKPFPKRIRVNSKYGKCSIGWLLIVSVRYYLLINFIEKAVCANKPIFFFRNLKCLT